MRKLLIGSRESELAIRQSQILIDSIKKYNNDDLKMLIKSLQCHRCCLLDKLHEEQKKIDCLDYLIYMLKKQMKED